VSDAKKATTGILLVHGGLHGPWCWDAFAGRLSDHGHDVRAVQLRGHDQRPGRLWYRLGHYVEDVRRAAADFAEPPILVGHSMGGLLVQKYLERNPAPGAVLMASIPTGGIQGLLARLAWRHPLVSLRINATLSLRPLFGTPAMVRDMAFTPTTPQEVVDHCHVRIQDESYLALVGMAVVWPRPRRVTCPVLVLGAEHDRFLTVGEVQRTAHAYRTTAEIFGGMGHHMMLDDGWEKVADRIDAWVRQLVGPAMSSS
jgi:pimeloyl-ACP methyl ester carboxylesterase